MMRSFPGWYRIGTLALVLVCTPAVAECDGVGVSITIGESLSVQPQSVEIYIDSESESDGRVCWSVSGLEEGLTVHLARKEGVKNLLPNLQDKIRLPQTTAGSGQPSDVGTWTYSVWVTHVEKGKILEVDPEVIIKKKGGA